MLKTKKTFHLFIWQFGLLTCPLYIKYCFLKTMVNRIPFFGFNISLCFYTLKEEKSIKRVILGCTLRNLRIRSRKRPQGRFSGGIYSNIKGSSAIHLQRFVFLLPLYFPGKASGQRLHQQQTISVREENQPIDRLTPRSFFLQSREQ